jgi:hypothetical protein
MKLPEILQEISNEIDDWAERYAVNMGIVAKQELVGRIIDRIKEVGGVDD